MNRNLFWSAALILSLIPSLARAQGVQTGTLTGKLRSSDGAVLADATIAIASTALQGERAARSDVNGVYVLANLPPGTYTVKISKAGLADVERAVTVPLGGTATSDATLSVATISESVVVEGAAPPPVTEIQTSADMLSSDVNLLPMGRTPYLMAELIPGVTTNTPNPGQITLSRGVA